MHSPTRLLDWNAENIPMLNNFAILNSCLLKNQQDNTKKYYFNDDKDISDSIDYDVPMLNNLAILSAELHENKHDVKNETELREVEIYNNSNYDYYCVNNEASSHAVKENISHYKTEKFSNDKFVDYNVHQQQYQKTDKFSNEKSVDYNVNLQLTQNTDKVSNDKFVVYNVIQQHQKNDEESNDKSIEYNIIMMSDKNGTEMELLDMKNKNKTDISCDQDVHKMVTDTANKIIRPEIKGVKERKVKRHLRGVNNVKNVFSHSIVKRKTCMAHLKAIKETNHVCETDIKSQLTAIEKMGSTVLPSKISETESVIVNPNKISKINKKSQDQNIIVDCQKQSNIDKTDCILHANDILYNTQLKRKIQNNVGMKTNTYQSEVCGTESEQTQKIPDDSSNSNDVENKDLLEKRTQFSCCKCNFKTFTRNIWYTHIHEHVRYRYLNEIFACHYCIYVTQKKNNMSRHLSTHTNDEPYTCKTWLTALHGLINYKYVQSLFACDYCEYITVKKNDLTRHIMTHTGDKPYSCHLCKYKSIVKPLLMVHLRSHTGEKYACDICDFKCLSDQGLKKHKKVHTGDKRYICKYCDRGFIQSGSLIQHIRTHTGERPYVCTICDYKGMQSIALKIHMRTHTGEKPYSCDLCEYKSTTSSTLSRHKRKHIRRKFSCKLCDYKCARSTTLVSHMKTHRKKKSFTCAVCNHVCTKKKDLNLHMMLHLSPTPNRRLVADSSKPDSGRRRGKRPEPSKPSQRKTKIT